MMRKIILIIAIILFFISISLVFSNSDSENWTSVDVGYESFKIPPQYADNPDRADDSMYSWDEDIDVFTIRHVTPKVMELYGYYMEKYPSKKVKVEGHDAVHFKYFDRHDGCNNSILWFSSGEEFYYINFRGANITPTIKEIVKSSSKSDYSHDEFYSILNEEYQNYKVVKAIESQRNDYPSNSKGFTYTSFGSNGFSVGNAHYY